MRERIPTTDSTDGTDGVRELPVWVSVLSDEQMAEAFAQDASANHLAAWFVRRIEEASGQKLEDVQAAAIMDLLPGVAGDVMVLGAKHAEAKARFLGKN